MVGMRGAAAVVLCLASLEVAAAWGGVLREGGLAAHPGWSGVVGTGLRAAAQQPLRLRGGDGYMAAYILARMGGKDEPTVEDVKEILESGETPDIDEDCIAKLTDGITRYTEMIDSGLVGEIDEERIAKITDGCNGRELDELIQK
ncbi:hypothetical protein T484DRAFT_1897486 [Baffinella frigidus]|nr:hypothetical protein T484DRAFT_1897486 [Cryptophyta sp. CCMP2293]